MARYLYIATFVPRMVFAARMTSVDILGDDDGGLRLLSNGTLNSSAQEETNETGPMKSWSLKSVREYGNEAGPMKSWSLNSENPCIGDYVVKFKLASMHSYFEVPTCSERSNGQPELYNCGRCLTGMDAGAEIHWNIPDCTKALCRWPRGAIGEAETIGPAEGVKIHPKCAWGIINELETVYKWPWRAASVGGVFQAIGGAAWNPINWGKVIQAGIAGGYTDLAKEAANTVDWAEKLNFDCRNYRPKAEVLKKSPVKTNAKNGTRTVEPIGAVCWNNVIDFHDLLCHYQAWGIDVTDGEQCHNQFYA